MNSHRTPLNPIAAGFRFAAFAAAIVLSPAAQAQVATVNGVVIPQNRLDTVLKLRAAGKQPDSPEVRAALRDTLINQEVVAQEAVKKGLHKNAEVVAQLDLQRQEALVNAFVQDYMKANPVSDDAVRKEYERVKPTIPAKEFKARHILVDKEEDAKDAIAQIKKGASFEKLAADKSKDTGSKGRGGDLDWAPATRYVKPFGEALGKLKKGQRTDVPVQSDFGWHVIRLDDERAVKVPTLDEAKPQIQQMLQGQLVQKMLADLRAKAKVE
ncbi:MAG TPA: peptidylprolyl isomerase [Burkholderiales bacterium]|nr:peptidylprolyl isomerase [Burkholderiales bacterium]